ncbi:hypothetical protein KQI63_00785 [bacterium]|nr:hypothetical protein [bacterium]
MKQNSRVMMAVFLVLLVIVAGCSEDDNPVDGGDTGQTVEFSDLNASQRDSVAVEMFAGSVVSAEAAANSGSQSLVNGEYFGGGFVAAGIKGPVANVSEAPEGWDGPDASGWYSYDVSTNPFLSELTVRWTPDLWADDYMGEPATRIEVIQQIDFSGSEAEGSLSLRNEWWTGINDERTLVEGSTSNEISASGDGAIEFSNTVSWEAVTVALDDYAGNYHTTGSYSFFDPEAGQVISLEELYSDFVFIADGSGTGGAGVASVELIRYEFDAVVEGSFERTGRYYLLSENWAIAHEFTISM